jgi:carboxyl-terminal processing protease
MTTRTRLVIILITAPILAFVVVGGLMARSASHSEAYPHLAVFDDVFGLTTNNYVEPVDPDRLMHGAMDGLAEALDSESAYLTVEEAKSASSHTPLPDGDVGIVLTRQYYLRVVSVRDGSPAAGAGIRSGDYVRFIDRLPTRDMSAWEGTRHLRGRAGSAVTLTMLRGNATEPHVVDLTRVALPSPAVTGHPGRDGVGVIRVTAFAATIPAAMRDAVASLRRTGARALILDVRGCAGEPLSAGIDAARLFVATGTLGYVETRSTARKTLTANPGDGSITEPLAVLVDYGTAGPAELLAAAIVGNKRGDLFGTRTAGRAAEQQLYPLPDSSALWMSYAHYLSVSGEPLHERGVVPSIVVEQPDVDFGAALPPGDATLERAIERLRTRSGS